MFSNITLVQTRCFCAVAEKGNFTVAAEQLCLSQSAVSQAVAALERNLGAQLLVRGRDGVTLTGAGLSALGEARSVLAAVERLAGSARGATTLRGSLRIGVVQSAAIRLLPGWLRQLRAAHPDVAVTLYEGTDPEVTAWVEAGIVEIGFTSRTLAGLSASPVAQDDYVVVVAPGHPFAVKASLALKDLDGQRMLLSGGGCETLIQELLASASSTPDIVCMVRDNAALASMVREGLGLTIMPEMALPLDQQGLIAIRLRPNMRRTLHAVTLRSERLGPVTTAFLELVQSDRTKPTRKLAKRPT
ncbi:LysR family transcriptional regulator [Bradyrhizobium sp. HKCCYLS20291]|uniref:LysR family transcriptional regulator n=1 Tax=Bradyrhizobium sp. HKCCYLS20291 TaxID=3420766 RepID=UPI003EB70187